MWENLNFAGDCEITKDQISAAVAAASVVTNHFTSALRYITPPGRLF